MLAFAYYLLKVIICSAVLFGYYWFFLRNKIYHAYNRYYLLAIVVISTAFPLFSIEIFHENAAKTTVIKMLQVVNAGDEYMDEIIISSPAKFSFGASQIALFTYCVVSTILFLLLVQMLISILNLTRKNEKVKIENVSFINTDAAKGTPFSFFQFIFWNRQINLESETGNRIFKHELAHIQERHSWDKMFINLVLIVFWINPLFWLIRKELSMIHEFIADKKAVEDGDTAAFADMILAATYPQRTLFITNSFFYSPIKRRLMMLTKIKNARTSYISRLLVLPLLVFVFAAFTLKAKEIGADKQIKKSVEQMINKITGSTSADGKLNEELTGLENIYTGKQITVVIDAGHGGSDGGAMNKNGIFEKDIALQLIKKIDALNTNDNIKIILSRTEDVYIDVKQKAAFAKAQNADLFISIHLDGNPKNKWNTVSGMSVFVARNDISNSEQSKLFASSILSSFKNNYELNVPTVITQRQSGVYVIQANNFPSVLIEAGYLTNDKDLAYLQSEEGQETFARNILDAINNYALAKSMENGRTFSQTSDSTLYYKGKKVKSYDVSVNTKDHKITSVTLFFYDNTSVIISGKEAQEIGIKLSTISNNKANLVSEKTPLYLSDSISANNQSVNLLMSVTKDSAEMVYLLNSKKISHSEAKQILSGGKNDIQVYDSDAAYKTFGIKTKNGLMNILSSNKSKGNPVKSNNNSQESLLDEVVATITIKQNKKDLDKVSLPENTLYIINGKIADKKAMELILPDDIESINVLKGNSALALYGEKGKNGVVEIITKLATTKQEILKSQSEKETRTNQDPTRKVFTKTEIEAQFPGGKAAWAKYLQKNINATVAVNEGWKPGTYELITKFIVEKDGTLSDFSAEKYLNSKTAKHCIEVLKNGPRWIPAMQNGHIVASIKRQPITFVISEEMDEDKKKISQIAPSVFKRSNKGAQALE